MVTSQLIPVSTYSKLYKINLPNDKIAVSRWFWLNGMALLENSSKVLTWFTIQPLTESFGSTRLHLYDEGMLKEHCQFKREQMIVVESPKDPLRHVGQESTRPGLQPIRRGLQIPNRAQGNRRHLSWLLTSNTLPSLGTSFHWRPW